MKTMEGSTIEGQDRSGRWHPVGIGRCRCGCVYLYALDDLRTIWVRGDWESEDQVDERCSDRACACHRHRATAPTQRLVFHQQGARAASQGLRPSTPTVVPDGGGTHVHTH